jgi:hypothetical protein
MNMSLDEIDRQIRQVENRITVERIALDDAIHCCMHSVREAVTSPKTLLALLGVGFTVGKILFKEKPEPQAAPAKKAGVLGLLTGVAGTAISLAGSRWGSVARWAAGRYFARKKATAAATRASTPAPTPTRTTPAYSRTPATTSVTSSPRPISARGL